jgi:hypothetical protein
MSPFLVPELLSKDLMKKGWRRDHIIMGFGLVVGELIGHHSSWQKS